MNSESKIVDDGKPKTKRFWLVKFAPFRTSWTEILKRGTFTLRGVRSPLACKHLARMRLGDPVLYYHSHFVPVATFSQPVSLATLKADARFESLALIRQSRLAVMPVSESQFRDILEIEKRATSQSE